MLERIKNDNSTRAIPTVMLTSSAEERDIVDSYKPVDFEQFVEIVSKPGFYWMLMNKTPG